LFGLAIFDHREREVHIRLAELRGPCQLADKPIREILAGAAERFSKEVCTRSRDLDGRWRRIDPSYQL